jgi:hypothetical protein
MMNDEAKLKLHTQDLAAQNIEKLVALFPICITDAKTGRLKRGIAVGRTQKFLPLPTMSANL